jgi:hypothetical protein
VNGSERGGVTKMGRSRPVKTERFRMFMGIAAALWLIGVLVAAIDGDPLMAIMWFCLAAFGGLSASGLAHRSQGVAYLALGLVVVAVGVSMGVFLAD